MQQTDSGRDRVYSLKKIVGIDEVGRGPLCGPVVAAAVILDPDKLIPELQNNLDGLRDSKKLSAKHRERIFDSICANAQDWAVGRAEVLEIDQLNILYATMLAMQRAVSNLAVKPELAYVDGNRCPELPCPAKAVIKGDSKIPEVAAASIVAKVIRDREMVELDRQWPGYGIAVHKGYPTAVHLAALKRLGPSPEHRRSFKPVKALLCQV